MKHLRILILIANPISTINLFSSFKPYGTYFLFFIFGHKTILNDFHDRIKDLDLSNICNRDLDQFFIKSFISK